MCIDSLSVVPAQVLNPMSAVAIPGQHFRATITVSSHTSLTLSSVMPPPPPHCNTRVQQWSHTGS